MLGTTLSALFTAVATIVAAHPSGESKEASRASRQAALKARKRPILLSGAFALLLGLLAAAIIFPTFRRTDPNDFATFKLIKGVSVQKSNFLSPWLAAKGVVPPQLSVGMTERGRGRDGALLVQANLNKGELTGVQLKGDVIQSGHVDMIVIWVFIENTSTTRAAQLSAHIKTRLRNADNSVVSATGPETKLTPGEWTPVIWMAMRGLVFYPANQPVEYGSHKCEFSSDVTQMLTTELLLGPTSASFPGELFVDDAHFYSTHL